MECKICLNKCFGQGCCKVNLEEIDCLLYGTRQYLADLQAQIINSLKFFNRGNVPKFIAIGREVKLNFFIIKQEMEALKMGFRSCLCDKDLCNIIQKLKAQVPQNCVPSCRTDQIYLNGQSS